MNIELARGTSAATISGRLTPEQQQRMAAAIKKETGPGLIVAGSFVATFGFLVFAALNAGDAFPSTYLTLGGLLVLALLLLGMIFWRRARLLAEVRAGELVHGTGHVDWKGGRYQAQVPGRTLDLTGFNLAAGSYDFSYLPRSGRVVGARLAAADSPTRAQDELRHALAVANHFNLDDLPAYRDGRQGPGTFRRLRTLWSTAGWLLLFSFVMMDAFATMVGSGIGQDLAPFVFLVGMFLFVWGLASAFGDIGRTFDMLGGRVLSTRGEVRKYTREIHGRYNITLYYYSLNGQEWRVSLEAWRALIEGQRYRLYYLPRSKGLVGIEPME